MYAEMRPLDDNSPSVFNGLSIALTPSTGGAMTAFVMDARTPSANGAIYNFVNSSSVGTLAAADTILNKWNKFAGAFTTGSAGFSLNGSNTSTSAPASIPQHIALTFGYYPLSPGIFSNGYIKKFAYYPVRLANAELQALTEE